MKISLKLTPESRQQKNELAAFFRDLGKPDRATQDELGDLMREGIFWDRFANEGGPSSPWPGLFERTQDEREAEDYGREHPILFRTGDYKSSFTDLDESTNIERLVTRPEGWTMEFGSSHRNVGELEEGRWNMLPRPVTLLEGSETEQIGDALDNIFDALFAAFEAKQ